jgi:hypothetical protein
MMNRRGAAYSMMINRLGAALATKKMMMRRGFFDYSDNEGAALMVLTLMMRHGGFDDTYDGEVRQL